MENNVVKSVVSQLSGLIDLLLIPFVLVSAFVLKLYRRVGSKRLILNTKLLKRIGVFAVRNHYYEPLFDDRNLSFSLRSDRKLPGVVLDKDAQLALLRNLNFQQDFDDFYRQQDDLDHDVKFGFKNGSFESGDAEFLFNFVRYLKPKRVFEIGCGTSTKIIAAALKKNRETDFIVSKHTCIEPYEQPWLEKLPEIDLIREKVEDLPLAWTDELGDGDFLFIDSSHMIRPQGDVLHEYLRVVPMLRKGVYVHVHDIFTPYDYLDEWVKEKVLFWNEQYLLEATLSCNDRYSVVAALNFLTHTAFDELKAVCTYLEPGREPGSFYFCVNK